VYVWLRVGVEAAAKTAFLNFCKRYMTETDPGQAVRKERYAKGRRRWARKDLVSHYPYPRAEAGATISHIRAEQPVGTVR